MTPANESTDPINVALQDGLDVPDKPIETQLDLPFLRVLISSVIETNGSVGITILANGMAVSGQAVPPDRWVRVLREQRQEEGAWAEMMDSLASKQGDYPTPKPAEIMHVHLIDAAVMAGGGVLQLQGTAWQIRLADIAGWTLGTMGAS